MADKITNFEDYKKRGNGEDIDIEIEDPYDFFNEQEREEYFKERQKEQSENRQHQTEVEKEQLEGILRKGDEEKPEGRQRRKDPEELEGRQRRKDAEKPESRQYRTDTEKNNPDIRCHRAKNEKKDFYDDCDDNEDIDEEYEDYEEDYEEEEEKGGFPIELFVRISSIISGIIILSCIAIVVKVKIFDKYFALDPDEETVVVSAIPAGFTEKNDTVTVTAENLNLRSSPSSESKDTIVTAVSKGTQLKRVAVSSDGSWALVEYEGNQLYASMKYLSE
ncbi:MAG: SH3 domain-containing protein [Butyrivibrio sp.]|nr:SH3 domain-containing protein [Butyrivibrio sp.]